MSNFIKQRLQSRDAGM